MIKACAAREALRLSVRPWGRQLWHGGWCSSQTSLIIFIYVSSCQNNCGYLALHKHYVMLTVASALRLRPAVFAATALPPRLVLLALATRISSESRASFCWPQPVRGIKLGEEMPIFVPSSSCRPSCLFAFRRRKPGHRVAR